MKKPENSTLPTPHTVDDVDQLIRDLETFLDDARLVRLWMIQNKRRAILVRFWPSILRGKDALKTGIRGLLEARHNC